MGFGLVRVRADGCFVFKWNKAIDINEPAQKAILFHDSAREDLLLQVKYDGALKDFGWLIPTPTLPKVEEGKMEPFYELSQLTQRHFGTSDSTMQGRPRGMLSADGEDEGVKVIEIKTVGAYEVSILSAKDASSLQHWLQAHEYSVPEGKSEIVEDYTRRGWYFVAVKIQLNGSLGFKIVSAASSKDAQSAVKARKTLQSKLSSGELHPLLITFDTPKAVFPLKISAVGGKPSEVSLYIIAAEPLLNGFIFGKSVEELSRQHAQWEDEKSARAEQLQKMRENSRAMGLRFFLDSFYNTSRRDPIPERLRDYTQDDLVALAREELGPIPTERLGEIFYAEPGGMLQCLRLTAEQIPVCARTFSRLKAGEWYLTKQVYAFAATEMRDLAFEPALAALSRTMSQPVGEVSSQSLAKLGPHAHVQLASACNSSNSIERLNAVIGIETSRNPDFGDNLAVLLKDQTPAIRLHALRASEANPESRFVDTIVALLGDPMLEIRQEASGYLSNHECPDRTPFYLALMRDPDANVRMYSLAIATWINRYAASDEVYREALRLLKDSDEHVRASALRTMRDKDVPRADVLPFLSSPVSVVSAMAHSMLRRGPSESFAETRTLSSMEVIGLVTNRVTTARLAGLKTLQQQGDAEAVELILPLLTDTNRLVRNRAFFVLRNITGEAVTENDPSKWQAWWKTNKSSFRPTKAVQ